jgi:protein-disulfide isomerase
MKNISLALLLASIALAGSETSSIAPGKSSGVPNAPIKLEVFSDFQCPSCKGLYEDALRPLMNDYVAKGKIYFIHRDFPLAMHPHSREAATWANASARVNHNKYELVCAELFRQQSGWAASGQIDAVIAGVLTPEEMKKARSLLSDKTLAAEMEQDLALGNMANVHQTPTMLVTHKGRVYPIAGAVAYPILRKFLDDLLSK